MCQRHDFEDILKGILSNSLVINLSLYFVNDAICLRDVLNIYCVRMGLAALKFSRYNMILIFL